MNEAIMVASAAAGGEHASSALFSIGPLEVTSAVTTMWGIMLILIVLSFVVSRNLKKVPGKLQNFVEWIVGGLQNFFSDVLGPDKGKRYLPFYGTMFLFIILCNYSGLLPSAGHLPGLAAPTSMLGVTIGLSVVVFFTTHYLGFKVNGAGYLKHFISPVAFMLPLLLLEEFVRPLSLSLRLYGNMFGEETVARQIFEMVPFLAPLPLMALSVLFCLVQALVFTMLASIYIDGATSEAH